MAGTARSSSMRGGRMRRSMSEINVVPYIDVMLVLLVIFMVTAPLVSPGVIDLPTVGKSSQAPHAPIEVILKSDRSLSVRVRDAKNPIDERSISETDLIALVRAQQAQSPDQPQPVIISADKKTEYDAVLKIMDGLQKANIQRIGLAVRPAT